MKIYSSVLVITAILLLSSCKKHNETNNGTNCVESYLGTIVLTPQELLIQPYGVNDSLVFINEHLNTLISYTCTDQVQAYQNVSENKPDSLGYIGCLGNYYKAEYSMTKFYNSTRKFIFIHESTPIPFNSMYTENGIQIGIGIPGDTIYAFDGFYAFHQDTLFNYPQWPAAQIDQFYDTITITNKLYHNVYLLEGGQLPIGSERIIKVYYSISDGILRFETNRNNVWSLQQKFILH